MVSAATPAISVIVPNYRHAPYLPERIESILNQTRRDFELLILDDCSPDNSREVIARYACDPRVRTEFNTVNSGNTFLQWRKGLSLTTAPYVWIAESDDFADPHLLERLAGAMDADPAIGLAFCETMTVDADGRDVAPYFDDLPDPFAPGLDRTLLNSAFVMQGRDFVRKHMIAVNPIPNASAVLFRRSALETIGGPQMDMRLCGDWMTYVRMLADHAVAHVPDRMNFFRTHGGNVRSALTGAVFLDETHRVLRWIEENIGSPPPDVARYVRRFMAQAVINVARGNSDKIPLARIPSALRRAAQLDRRTVPLVAGLLLRETGAGLAARVGLRRP